MLVSGTWYSSHTHTHTQTQTLIQLHIAYLFVGESKWVSLKIGARVYLKWKESPFMHNFCCFRSVVVVAGAALWQNENIRPTFYIINWQWVYVFVFMCVCTQLDSFRLNSTRLAHESAVLSVSLARYSNRDGTRDEGLGGVGRWYNPSAISQRT